MKEPDQDLRQLLPWHVNGTLDARRRAEVDKALADSEELAAERVWLESLRQKLRQQGPERAEDAGLDILMARIAGEREGSVLPFPAAPVARPAWRTRGFAIAATIILGQAALLGALLLEREQPGELTPLSGPQAVADGALLQVVFNERASEAAIRAALLEARGEIVGGPGALGVYLVRAEAPNALALLRKRADVVESAVLEEAR